MYKKCMGTILALLAVVMIFGGTSYAQYISANTYVDNKKLQLSGSLTTHNSNLSISYEDNTKAVKAVGKLSTINLTTLRPQTTLTQTVSGTGSARGDYPVNGDSGIGSGSYSGYLNGIIRISNVTVSPN